MNRFVRKNILVLVALLLIFTGCAPSLQELKQSDTQSLREAWMDSNSLNTRLSIIDEFERRKDVDSTIACLSLASHHTYGKTKGDKDIVPIIKALGNLKDPKAINDIKKVSEKDKQRSNHRGTKIF